MSLLNRNPHEIIRKITIGTLAFTIAWSFALVLAQIRPFWVDEWRVIYNLKYKDAAALMGPLDYMQQFPRVYLELIKAFAAPFDYSYFTLRLPSFLTGTAAILLGCRLMKKMYASGNMNKFLFVLILVSCHTFREYFIQIKQYTMDILLCLVALYQLIELLKLADTTLFNKRRYLLLCMASLVVPYFSYTYPIAIAPVFMIIFMQNLSLVKDTTPQEYRKILLRQWLPLIPCMASISVFYITDVKQVMADHNMHLYWGNLLMQHGFSFTSFVTNGYLMFAQAGSGLLFSIIFGILGIAGFGLGIYNGIGSLRKQHRPVSDYYSLYAVMVLLIALVLFIMGKLPLGEPRLNIFTIPSISILIISLLDALRNKFPGKRPIAVLSFLLYAGLIGNMYTSIIHSVTGAAYAKKLDIYVSTENAIIMAQAKKLPIFITHDIAYPYENTADLPYTTTIPGDWVLKTFPAYKVQENIPVYALNSMEQLNERISQLPPDITSVMVGDGRSFRIINR